MDWFERLTGFRETDYRDTQARLEVDGDRLLSRVNGRSYGIGRLELPTLGELRAQAASTRGENGRLRFRNVAGDVRELITREAHAGALFQVASQFNLLEMIGPSATPEDGVTRYEYDRTQGPACAMAAGAATIYRNYFVPVAGAVGQTRSRQLNTLADFSEALGQRLGWAGVFEVVNGYAFCNRGALADVAANLTAASAGELDRLRETLRIGVHGDVEVTEAGAPESLRVSQAFCSALPIAYDTIPAREWRPLAELILEAAYEATLLAGVVNARSGRSPIVFLTRLGGGAFGNDDDWIDKAIERALGVCADYPLDVRLVLFAGAPPDG